MRIGPDRRLYVAQAWGSLVSAVDLETSVVSPIWDDRTSLIGPDDLAFDDEGTLYVTDTLAGSVVAQSTSGKTRVVADNLPSANGICVFEERIFVDECREGGRLLELDPHGGIVKTLVPNLPGLANALDVGPDRHLYFPDLREGCIWRVPLQGGIPERVVENLAVPIAAKFGPDQKLWVITAADGGIHCIDIVSRQAVLTSSTRRGCDNLCFDESGQLFVSHFVDGGVTVVGLDGAHREVSSPGFVWPCGMSWSEAENALIVVDLFSISSVTSDGERSALTILQDHPFAGMLVDVIAMADGSLIVSTTAGLVARYRPHNGDADILMEELDGAAGLASSEEGDLVVAESNTGNLVLLLENGRSECWLEEPGSSDGRGRIGEGTICGD